MIIQHKTRRYRVQQFDAYGTPIRDEKGLAVYTDGNPVDYTVAEAVENSLYDDIDREPNDNDADHLQRICRKQAEALGAVVAYLVGGDHSDDAKLGLVEILLSSRLRVS
jgi:hypothetical protein